MPWNFERHPISDVTDHLGAIEKREKESRRHQEASGVKPTNIYYYEEEPVPDELNEFKSVSEEATRRVGGVAIEPFHGGSRRMARSPEEIILEQEQKKKRRLF